MHAHALRAVERQVGDVARERVADVDHVALAIAQPARAQPRHGLVGAFAVQRRRDPARSSGPPATASHSTIGCSSGGSSFRRSAISCSSVEGSCAIGSPGALDAHELGPVAVVAFADLEHAALEQRVHHLQEEERIAAGARQEVGADLATPSLTPSRAWSRRIWFSALSPPSSMRTSLR